MPAPNTVLFASSCNELNSRAANEPSHLSLSTSFLSVFRNGDAPQVFSGIERRPSTLVPPATIELVGGSERFASRETRLEYLSSILDHALRILAESENHGVVEDGEMQPSSDQEY